MKKLIFLIFTAFLTVFFLPPTAQAQTQLTLAGGSAVLKSDFNQPDNRVAQLRGFLKSYNSPLTPSAQVFIDAADQAQIDWRLVPAITGVESTFGKQIPLNSFNAYGWANGTYRFQSWEESITIVSQALREKYYNRGLDTPYKIGPVYAPPSQTWAGKVTHFMEEIEAFNAPFSLFELTLTI